MPDDLIYNVSICFTLPTLISTLLSAKYAVGVSIPTVSIVSVISYLSWFVASTAVPEDVSSTVTPGVASIFLIVPIASFVCESYTVSPEANVSKLIQKI